MPFTVSLYQRYCWFLTYLRYMFRFGRSVCVLCIR